MPSNRRRFTHLWGYAVPWAILTFLLVTYLIDRDFYLKYIIHPQAREGQLVEIATFTCSATASLLLLVCSTKLWRLRRKEALGSCVLVAILGIAALFFAGEEISWGQTYLKWKTPPSYQEFSGETNLHNSPVPVNTLGNVFLVAYFFVLPGLWRYGKRGQVPHHFSYAIAPGPVICCLGVGYLWRGFKSTYRAVYAPEVRENSMFYVGFVEQINEHKELLVAVALLMYACSIYVTIRGWAGDNRGEGAPTCEVQHGGS